MNISSRSVNSPNTNFAIFSFIILSILDVFCGFILLVTSIFYMFKGLHGIGYDISRITFSYDIFSELLECIRNLCR